MKIGITGHQEIADPPWVKQQILKILNSKNSPSIGITSLAVGADQLFAEAVLDTAGTLQVIVPFDGYADVFKTEGRKEYERLLRRAIFVETLPVAGSQEESFFNAGKRMVDIAELVIAVWNGKPAAGLGGTADVVKYANSQKKPYVQINPVSRVITIHDK